MYDVKQFDPKEWSSPPTEGRLVDKPNLGKAIVGRGAVNQKGRPSLRRCTRSKALGKSYPLISCSWRREEEIGSSHIGQIAHRPEVQAALSKCTGVFMPSAMQSADSVVT